MAVHTCQQFKLASIFYLMHGLKQKKRGIICCRVFAKKKILDDPRKKDILLFFTRKKNRQNRHLFVPQGSLKCWQERSVNSQGARQTVAISQV